MKQFSFFIGCLCCLLFAGTTASSQTNPIQLVSTWLLTANGTVADGNMVVFASQYSNNVDNWDAKKMSNPGENFGLSRQGFTLAVEARQPVSTDTLYYKMSNLMQTSYQLMIVHENMRGLEVICTLFDKYLNTTTTISLSDTIVLPIMIDGNPQSSAPDRFRLQYRPLAYAVLPVNIVQFTASINEQSIAEIQWTVNNELQMLEYVLEQSRDGHDFIPITILEANNATSGKAVYQYADKLSHNGYYFYRIKAVSQNGFKQYSQILKLVVKSGLDAIQIFPNPVTGHRIGLQMSSQQEAKVYNWQLHTNTGVLIQSGTIPVPAQTTRSFIQLQKKVSAGLYILTLQDEATRKGLVVAVQ